MKRILAALMAAALAAGTLSVGAFASGGEFDMAIAGLNVYDEDGAAVSGISVSDGKVTADYILPATEYYLELPSFGTLAAASGSSALIEDVTDTDKFSFKLDRDKNGKYLDEVKFVSKKLDGLTRADYIKFSFKETDLTEDEKVTFDVYFKAKKDNAPIWDSGDRFNIRFELWLQNDVAEGEDADIDTGGNVVFKPVDNETNTITWGSDDEIASLKFEANDDAEKFYAKLSTKSNSTIYSEYGDPVDADLYFRTFVGSPKIDSTSRATLTLYNPWYDDDGERTVDPYDVYIYEVDGDTLTDLTDRFTYADEDDTEAGIDGWQVKVRALGSYVISDTPLDAYDGGYYDEPVDEAPVEQPTIVTPPRQTPAPPTGAGDLASAAALAGAFSLGLAGILRKRRK